jgi:hypothetical protein
MGRARDLANILSSSGNVALDSELGLSLITPTSVAVTGGSATSSISSTGAVSFTSASAISLNGVFNSNYLIYKVISTIQATSGTPNLQIRYRNSGTDSTSTNYFSFGIIGGGTALGQVSLSGQTTGRISQISTDLTYFSMDIYGPNTNTTMPSNVVSYYPSGGSYTTHTVDYNGVYVAEGFTIFPATSSVSGTIMVYGYRK